jgi:hypothetical protein
MEIQWEKDIRIILNQALDDVGNPSEAYFRPSRPSLTSYALETRGALRILGFLALDDLISNDLIPQGGWGSSYIAREVQREPLDQTDLRNDTDVTLGGGGGTF